MPSSSSQFPSTTTKPRKPLQHPQTPSSTSSSYPSSTSSLTCRNHSQSATATLDLLILILVLISGTFLLTSYFSYLFNSLSLLIPLFPSPSLPPLHSLLFIILFISLSLSFALCRRSSSSRRKCSNPSCKGLKKSLEFDLQLHTEDSLKSSSVGSTATSFNNITGGSINTSKKGVSEVDIEKLPWKGGSETNPDYECLRAELRKMAPPNGRAVLLFRAKCGCPVAKLVGWGPKKGRKHKKLQGFSQYSN